MNTRTAARYIGPRSYHHVDAWTTVCMKSGREVELVTAHDAHTVTIAIISNGVITNGERFELNVPAEHLELIAA